MQQSKFGVYLNTKRKKVLRINSPYWIPSGKEWVLLTTDVNMTLLAIRNLAKEKKLVDDIESIVWGDLPEIPNK